MDWSFEIWFDGCCIHEDADEFESEFEVEVAAQDYIDYLINEDNYDDCIPEDFEVKIKKNGEY